MIAWLGDNIISSLGFTTEANYQAAKDGKTGIAYYPASEGISEPYYASAIDKEALNEAFAAHWPGKTHYTPLEKAAVLSVAGATGKIRIDLSAPDVLFIFSSTKGNVHLLDEPDGSYDSNRLYLWHSARTIAAHFGNPNEPVVVSNACISGACAQIAAMRELEGRYNYAVVVGADMLSRFIISGFQSLKALAPAPCRPFDAEREGLNLGEAAATIIYKKIEPAEAPGPLVLLDGSIRNDANHISGPSRTGEGSFLALQAILPPSALQEIAFVNAHGTATPYNDRMEAIALGRAGLDTVPVNSLKGYFGHTLGAAGVLESIISSHALLDSTVLSTCGFRKGEEGACPMLVSRKNMQAGKPYYIKMLSGFGGCNAALLFKKTVEA
ncbi:beta-ketoacyl synthase [Bacteroidia bacterium]|nr:beta-ketoacyl synthase [Bacteroidia bacterium]